jgi:hypothetical protein
MDLYVLSALLEILNFSCRNNIVLYRITESAVVTLRKCDTICIMCSIFLFWSLFIYIRRLKLSNVVVNVLFTPDMNMQSQLLTLI